MHEIHARRWIAIAEPIATLEVILLDAEILWGKKISQEINSLRKLIHELGLNINHYINGIDNPVIIRNEGDLRWKIICSIAISSGNSEQPDDFEVRLNKIINRIESIARPALSSN